MQKVHNTVRSTRTSAMDRPHEDKCHGSTTWGQVPWIDHTRTSAMDRPPTRLSSAITLPYICLSLFRQFLLLKCWYDNSHWLQLFWSGGRYKAGRNREANQGISLIPCKTCVMIWLCWCVCSVLSYVKIYMETCQPIPWFMYLFHLICLQEYDRMFVEQVIIK